MAKHSMSFPQCLVDREPTFSAGKGRFTIALPTKNTVTYNLHLSEDEARHFVALLTECSKIGA